MSELKHVLARVAAGKQVRFYQDFYGRQSVETRTLWVIRQRVNLSNDEIQLVKNALHERHARGRSWLGRVRFVAKRATAMMAPRSN
jgi:hypothetical protein